MHSIRLQHDAWNFILYFEFFPVVFHLMTFYFILQRSRNHFQSNS